MSRAAEKPKVDFRTDLHNRLKNPFQMRIICCSIMLLIGYAGIYSPLSAAIDENKRLIREEERRLDIAAEVTAMRDQLAAVRDRLPEDTDTNEWIGYIVSAVRDTTLKLQRLDPEEDVDLGPYRAVKLNIAIEGSYAELDTFLHWIESNPRLFRVDSVKVMPPRDGHGNLVMNLTVLGLMG